MTMYVTFTVYSPFSDGVGSPLQNIPCMNNIGAEFLQLDAINLGD